MFKDIQVPGDDPLYFLGQYMGQPCDFDSMPVLTHSMPPCFQQTAPPIGPTFNLWGIVRECHYWVTAVFIPLWFIGATRENNVAQLELQNTERTGHVGFYRYSPIQTWKFCHSSEGGSGRSQPNLWMPLSMAYWVSPGVKPYYHTHPSELVHLPEPTC